MKSLSVCETGSINGVAVFFLALLTIVGASVTYLSINEVWISRNEEIRKRDFYIAEGGAHREGREIGSGKYNVENIHSPLIVATEKSPSLPGPAPHFVSGEPYDFSIEYKGFFPPLKGFSNKHFSRYDYEVQARHGLGHVTVRYARIGPKAL